VRSMPERLECDCMRYLGSRYSVLQKERYINTLTFTFFFFFFQITIFDSTSIYRDATNERTDKQIFCHDSKRYRQYIDIADWSSQISRSYRIDIRKGYIDPPLISIDIFTYSLLSIILHGYA